MNSLPFSACVLYYVLMDTAEVKVILDVIIVLGMLALIGYLTIELCRVKARQSQDKRILQELQQSVEPLLPPSPQSRPHPQTLESPLLSARPQAPPR